MFVIDDCFWVNQLFVSQRVACQSQHGAKKLHQMISSEEVNNENGNHCGWEKMLLFDSLMEGRTLKWTKFT